MQPSAPMSAADWRRPVCHEFPERAVVNFTVDYVADLPQCIETLAVWHDAEWRHLNPPRYDTAARIREYRAAAQRLAVPVMFVAHRDGEVLGSVRIIADDMETHPELTPWLATLFVAPPHRRRGIGRALIERALVEIRSIGLPAIYLFTETPAYYSGRGWVEWGREMYYGQPVTILHRRFT